MPYTSFRAIESCSTAQSTSPRVSHSLSHSRRSSPLSSVVSKKATTQSRSSSSTLSERETTPPRRLATYYCSYQCSRHHATSSSSASEARLALSRTRRLASRASLRASLSSAVFRRRGVPLPVPYHAVGVEKAEPLSALESHGHHTRGAEIMPGIILGVFWGCSNPQE